MEAGILYRINDRVYQTKIPETFLEQPAAKIWSYHNKVTADFDIGRVKMKEMHSYSTTDKCTKQLTAQLSNMTYIMDKDLT